MISKVFCILSLLFYNKITFAIFFWNGEYLSLVLTALDLFFSIYLSFWRFICNFLRLTEFFNMGIFWCFLPSFWSISFRLRFFSLFSWMLFFNINNLLLRFFICEIEKRCILSLRFLFYALSLTFLSTIFSFAFISMRRRWVLMNSF